jgi:fucose 4-O-acetylase-like acetyltransferase
MTGSDQGSRIDWIDTAKGLGIILVVVGHVMRGLTAAHVMDSSFAVKFTDAWIYSFHMPFFFFLSGLFLFHSATKSSLREFISEKTRMIAYPYVVWSIVTVLLKAVLGPIPNTPRDLSDLLLIPYSPIEQFWFLYVLFIVVVLFGTIFAFGLKPWFTLALASAIYLTVFPESLSWNVLHMVRVYAIYVAIGTFFGVNYLRHLQYVDSVPLALVAIVGFSFPLADIALSEQKNDLLCAVSGTIGAAALSLLFSRLKSASFLGFLGTLSLVIFVGHTIASAAARTCLELLHITSPGIHILVGIGAGLFLPIALYRGFNMIGFPFGFTFPKKVRQTTVVEHVKHGGNC